MVGDEPKKKKDTETKWLFGLFYLFMFGWVFVASRAFL